MYLGMRRSSKPPIAKLKIQGHCEPRSNSPNWNDPTSALPLAFFTITTTNDIGSHNCVVSYSASTDLPIHWHTRYYTITLFTITCRVILRHSRHSSSCNYLNPHKSQIFLLIMDDNTVTLMDENTVTLMEENTVIANLTLALSVNPIISICQNIVQFTKKFKFLVI